MTTPHRIQLRRTKGWRKPEGAVVVSRPSKWGNPWTAESEGFWRIGNDDILRLVPAPAASLARIYRENLVGCLASFGQLPYTADDVRRELAGRDLVCWCPLDQPCHADVLLEIANDPCGGSTRGGDGCTCDPPFGRP